MFEKLEMRRLFAAWVHPDVGYFDESTKTVYLFGTTLADTFVGELLPSGYNRLSAYFSRNNVHVASYGPDDVNGLVIDAGAGNDVLNISVSANGQGHALSTTLLGGNGNDSIKGGNGPDSIAGGDGDDTLHGLDGNDTIIGAGGKDLLLAGYGPTDYQGGAQRDTLDFAVLGSRLVTIDTAGLRGEPGVVANDFNNGSNVLGDVENILGSNGRDTIIGNAADNYFDGRGGNDFIDGGSGNDTLIGGPGLDTLWGSSGHDMFFITDGEADSVEGGSGDDILGDSADPSDVVNL